MRSQGLNSASTMQSFAHARLQNAQYGDGRAVQDNLASSDALHVAGCLARASPSSRKRSHATEATSTVKHLLNDWVQPRARTWHRSTACTVRHREEERKKLKPLGHSVLRPPLREHGQEPVDEEPSHAGQEPTAGHSPLHSRKPASDD